MEAEDYDWDHHDHFHIPEISPEGRDLERQIDRAERDLGLDLSKVMRYLWPKTTGGENRHCPECGWARIDTDTRRCPEHKAMLVPDAP